MAENKTILWIGEHSSLPANVRQATRGWDLKLSRHGESLASQLAQVPLALVWPNGATEDPARLTAMLTELQQAHAVSIFFLPDGDGRSWRQIAKRQGQFVCVSQDASAGEIAARMETAADLGPVLRVLRQELSAAHDRHNGTARLVEEMGEEMRLAARLQRDFLPRRLPEVGPVRFGVLYRPATWVSGDIYDIIRLDETHIGFYVADVVGHGMPAALLTMFIKKALQTKRIMGSTYEIVPPDVAMTELNTDICDQNLSSCQFCTAVYGILDVRNLTLTYSRAGHPEPLWIHTGQRAQAGGIERLNTHGSLLGIFPDERFPSRQVRLVPGDRVLFYSDGLEEAMRPPEKPRGSPVEQLLEKQLLRPRDEMLIRISDQMDAYRGAGQLSDDVTVMVLDIEG